jgi:secreted trypsin-like serine protease
MRAVAICAVALGCCVSVAPWVVTATRASDDPTPYRNQVKLQERAALAHATAGRALTRDDQPRIIGGTVAPAGKWPFQVALLDAAVASNYNAQFCGGSLVGGRHVLTAAHCVKGMRASALHILTGTQSLASGGTRRTVASIAVHPKYKASTSDYDIAVVTLKNSVSGITPIAMLGPANENALASPGTLAYVTGWGDILKGSGESYPKKLYQVQMPIVSRDVCNAPVSYDGEITTRMICAGLKAGGKDSCQGDSGGPLIVQDSHDRWRMQAGIVSFGEGCALKNFYGVYSRLAVLSAWARSIIGGAD